MSFVLGALGKLYNFGTKFELFSVIYFWFFAWIIFVWKNEEFWKIYFLTKFVPESIKMNLHTSSTPFWNEISISNLLILSNFWFFGLHCHRCGKHLCRFFASDSILFFSFQWDIHLLPSIQTQQLQEDSAILFILNIVNNYHIILPLSQMQWDI